MKLIKARPGFVGGLVLGLLLAGSGFAIAAIPDSNGTISSCVTVKSGAIRLIDTDKGQTCRKSERLLTWSQTGTPGGGGGSFRLRSAGVDLGVIANESNGCWIVWNGTEFRSYDLFGAPCQNVVKPTLGVFYSAADCTGNAYLIGVGTPGPRGPYGMAYPIVETPGPSPGTSEFRLVQTATLVGSPTEVLSSYDSVNGCQVLEPFNSSILNLVTFGNAIPIAAEPLSVVPG